MSKTYLQLINKVLVNLRETVVTDLSATYTQLVAEFVNLAKETVEDSWRWRILTNELRITTTANGVTYPLTLAGGATNVTTAGVYPDERSFVLKDDKNNSQAFDITQIASNVLYPIRQVAKEDLQGDIYLAPSRSQSLPYMFAYSMEGGTPTIYLSDPPPASRLCAFRMCIPQAEFTAGTEVLSVPWRPVVSFATGLAMQERGEELGQSADLYITRYNAELIRAQELDRDFSYDQLLVNGTGNN